MTHIETVINNLSFTTTVTSSAFTNDPNPSGAARAWTVLTKVGAMTSTPTLTVTVNVSIDGVNWVAAGTGAAINSANGVQRLSFAQGGSGTTPNFGPITEPFIQVVATFGGSGNFANVSCWLIGD